MNSILWKNKPAQHGIAVVTSFRLVFLTQLSYFYHKAFPGTALAAIALARFDGPKRIQYGIFKSN
ncbi:MAG TPA: hypothetical protein VFI24_10745 [Pyrinomonadaceae bacterium]|nr:hypothetical protein [Pyrinomonadaceae bacterium]